MNPTVLPHVSRALTYLLCLFATVAFAPGCTPTLNVSADPLVIHIKIDQQVRMQLDDDLKELIQKEDTAAKLTQRDGGLTQAARTAQLKSSGVLGERFDGYLGRVNHIAATADGTVELLREVNDERRQTYYELAQRRKTAVGAIEAIAGAKRTGEAAPGEFVLDHRGSWHQR